MQHAELKLKWSAIVVLVLAVYASLAGARSDSVGSVARALRAADVVSSNTNLNKKQNNVTLTIGANTTDAAPATVAGLNVTANGTAVVLPRAVRSPASATA
jgi:hypothetical protein